MTDDHLIDVARSYLGVSWKHQGRSRFGVDCIGLIVLSARACGLDVPMIANYGRTPYFIQAKKELIKFCRREATMYPGSLVVYKANVVHIAIATGPTTVIQSINTVGRVTESTINFVPSQFWRFQWPS